MVVLVIEDDGVTRRALVNLLSRAGHLALSVEKGADGLRVMQTIQAECLVLDLNLPDCGGLQVLEWVRRQTHRADLPTVVFSAEVDPALRERAQALGADWVSKSAGSVPLLAIIKSYGLPLA